MAAPGGRTPSCTARQPRRASTSANGSLRLEQGAEGPTGSYRPVTTGDKTETHSLDCGGPSHGRLRTPTAVLRPRPSVVLGEQDALAARAAGLDARARLGRGALAGERDAADRRLRLGLDRELGLARPVPVRVHELRARALEHVGEVLPRVDEHGRGLAPRERGVEQRPLQLV